MRSSLIIALAAASLASSLPAVAQAPNHPFLDPLFTDNMVLQRDRHDAIWGWTTPNQSVTVTLDGKSSSGVAGTDGKWVVDLQSLHAGGPYTIDIAGPRTVELKNVLFGDVWICSGQSNMQFGMGNLVNGGKDEIAAANHPMIRLFMVPNVTAPKPQDLVQGSWAVCSPSTIAQGGWNGFTAVGYFFGRDLQQDTKVPIGLIETTWGGTPGEAWVSADALKTMTDFANVDDIVAQDMDSSSLSADDLARRTDAFIDANDGLSKQNPNPASPAYDDSSWKSMTLPVAWQSAGMPDYHGVVWFRRTFDLTSAQTGKDLPLHLGPIDDRDCTWVNGVRVGGGVDWEKPRDYTIPASLLNAGKNVITIRVLDTGGLGGVDGKPEQMRIELPDGTALPLNGPWRYRASTPLSSLPEPPATTTSVALQNVPSMLYNAMIAPLIPYGIKGAIWYQGETNVGRGKQYQTLLPLLIRDWRTRWGEKNFPFLIVQLANFTAVMPEPTDEGWARLREAQAITARTVPNTGLAVTIDIGDAGDIHPKDKQDVGRRLELVALAKTYGRKVEYSGPEFSGMEENGQSIRLTFSHADGLAAHGDKVTGFAIAGADRKFYWADAKIDGNTVIVSSPLVPSPVAVRYAWAANPICDLYNKDGLPAIPFRTDTW